VTTIILIPILFPIGVICFSLSLFNLIGSYFVGFSKYINKNQRKAYQLTIYNANANPITSTNVGLHSLGIEPYESVLALLPILRFSHSPKSPNTK
jgi:hypothetical protein